MRSLEWSNSRRQKVEGWVPGAGGRWGWGNECLMGTDFQFGKMKRVLWIDSGDGCTTV